MKMLNVVEDAIVQEVTISLLASVSTGCREIIERRLLGAVENQFRIAYRTKYIFLMRSSPV
jgi:hypothetical protein